MENKIATVYDLQTEHGNMTVTDADLVNPDYDYTQFDHLYLLHNEFGVIALVLADNEQDALDEIVDRGKLDSYRSPEHDGCEEVPDGVAFLGNASEAFDLGDYVQLIEITKPKFSICGLLFASAQATLQEEE